MATHCEAMVGFMDDGAEVFDYGNSLRAEAKLGGFERAFDYPGFLPAYIRPLFCEGKGPFRWVALSGDPADIAATDRAVLDEFPDDEGLHRWITMAGERVAFQGLPARICWLGYGERHRLGLRFNEMVRSGELQAPIVIGRDHLDSGSVASPYRETEAMIDGSDAIADWPLLNGLVNTCSGATWVSIHHGGGVGIGRSIHAGQVSVADGTDLAAEKLERVLTNDPGMGVIRHVDAGYERAIEVADERGVTIPMRAGSTVDAGTVAMSRWTIEGDWDRDGAVCVRQAFTAEQVGWAREAIDENLADLSPRAKRASADSDGAFIEDFCNWHPAPRHGAVHPRVAGRGDRCRADRVASRSASTTTTCWSRSPARSSARRGTRTSRTTTSTACRTPACGSPSTRSIARRPWSSSPAPIAAPGTCRARSSTTRPSGSPTAASPSCPTSPPIPTAGG